MAGLGSRWAAVLAAVVLLGVGSASAQRRSRPFADPTVQTAPLRARLAALEQRGADARVVRSITYLLDIAEQGTERRRGGRESPWLARAARYLTLAERGRDPYAEARGEITLRAYRSPVSETLQGYAVYVPPDYDAARAYPLLVALHGGSSNGNLYLALTLGAQVPWDAYFDSHFIEHRPVATPDWIIVAPDGFGNSMWRFMGERDVLDVLEDVRESYRVDADRVVLNGHSNGGLGSFNIGMRHAWRFAAVAPISGAPGWIHYLGMRLDELHTRALEPQSAWPLIENARNTHLHAHHGRLDPGPMRPRYVEALRALTAEALVPFELDWYGIGHDLVWPVHRQGGVWEREADRRRDPRPASVTLVTGDYRASRQHWVRVTRIDGYPSLARVEAHVASDTIEVRTERVRALALDLDGMPRAAGRLSLRIDGTALSIDPPRGWLDLRREGSAWVVGAPQDGPLAKRPGLSGPIHDAYWERLVHVYGTQSPAHEATLRRAAERGARSFVPHTHTVRQRVLADTEVTPALAASSHLVLYGGPGDNAVLEALRDRLPIRAEPDAIVVGGERVAGRRVGARFVYPSPLSPSRYVLVHTGTDPEAVLAGDTLPAFLPDYVVYDARRMPSARPNVARTAYLAAGYFDDRWRLVDR